MPIKELPIINHYDKQRFTQFSPMDVANHYIVESPSGKKGRALYPAMGRRHIRKSNRNRLVYDIQPRKIFRSIDFIYIVVGATIYQVDTNLNQRVISDSTFTQVSGDLNFAFLPAVQGASPDPGNNTQAVFCMFCDGDDIFVIDEANGTFSIVTDDLRPPFPLYVAAFGNRFAVSTRNSTQFQLTQVNMGGAYNPDDVFTINGAAVFAQESGLIRQMAVLHQQLYIFTDYTTGIWSNTVSTFNAATFPWKKNTSYDFDYGIADDDSLDVDFGMITWLAQNRNGLVQFMSTNGQSPQPISSQAVNVLIQKIASSSNASSLLSLDSVGFLYQYEDTTFYRVSIGPYVNYKTLDRVSFAVCLEFNFNTKTWHRCIELNGERNRIEDHVFFVNKHLVTVEGQSAIYEMSGSIYTNELQNPDVPVQDPLAFIAYPMRYENITPIISEDDYSEFITDWIQIDFVWGEQTFIHSDIPFANTVFLVAEASTPESPVYLVAEDGETFIIKDGTNTPDVDSLTYNALFKPHIELYWSDDGGVSFHSADVLEFSQLGIYSWRMRWYQGGPSRNRVYKLVCVSPAPIVILGGIQNVRRVSGGAL